MLMNSRNFLILTCFILILLTILFQNYVNQIDDKYYLYGKSAFFSSVTKGLKKFIGHECWNQADIYLHQGLIHDNNEHMHDEDDLIHEFHNHEEQNPLLPYNRSDFLRTRHVKPFDDRELLPWFKMSAFMDPNLTRAYVSGGYWLAWRLGKAKEAVSFLEEGIVNNPDAPDILAELGIIFFDAEGRLGTRNIERALSLFNMALKNEKSALRQIQLLTYRSESFALLGDYKNALADIDKKIILLVNNGLDDTERFISAIKRRDYFSEMLDVSN